MGKMKLNPTVDGLTGKLGNMVHRQLWGKHVVSRLPDFSDRVLTPKQVAQNNKYKGAGQIWRGLAAEVKAAYNAWGKRLNKPPYALFNKNCACPPTVEDVDVSKYAGQAGQPIRIRAVDLFEVASVEIRVREAGGNVVEKGAAVRSGSDSKEWVYQTTATVKNPVGASVEAVATNWPGNQGNRIQLV